VGIPAPAWSRQIKDRLNGVSVVIDLVEEDVLSLALVMISLVRVVGGSRRTAALSSAEHLQPQLQVLDKTDRCIGTFMFQFVPK
jgi:hypothetical protein